MIWGGIGLKNVKENMRESNLELLRIVAMLMIMFYHCTHFQLGESWKILQVAPFSWNYVVTIVLGFWGTVGNVLFVAISAWFLVDNTGIHIKKVIMLMLQAWMVCVIMMGVKLVLDSDSVSLMMVIKEALTPIYHQYGFLTTYIAFYCLVPFMQKFIRSISYEALKVLCIMLTVIMPIYTLIFKSLANGVAWFVYIFFLVACLKKQDNNFIERNRYWLFLASFGSILAIVFVVKIWKDTAYTELLNDNILILILALSIFYIFKNMHIGKSRCINGISSKMLGVYILHENMLIQPIWEDIFHMSWWHLNSSWYALYYIAIVLLVFIICTMIESVRAYIIDIKLLGNWDKFNTVCKGVDNKVNSVVFDESNGGW